MTENKEMVIPHSNKLLKPVIDALIQLGKSGRIDEINQQIFENLDITDKILNISHGNSNMSEIEYRLHWARTTLKNLKIIINTKRGVWVINPEIEEIKYFTEDILNKLVKELREQQRIARIARKQQKGSDESSAEIEEEEEEIETLWQDDLLEIIRRVNPSGFENLSKYLLREVGFSHLEVTGRSHDGGIDGRGVLKLNDLIGINVLFQCKRYSGSVSANLIRDFRGAMEGRAEKGIFITTGTFTQDAIREARREGAKPIDLIDGDSLTELLKKYRLGVKVEIVEKVIIEEKWFQQFF